MAAVEAVITSILDDLGETGKKLRKHKALVTVAFSGVLFLLGLPMVTEMAVVEACVTSVIDELDVYSKSFRKHKTMITVASCIILFLLGLPMCTQGGIYLLNLVNMYGVGVNLLIIAFLECIAVAYAYGVDRFFNDMEAMLGFRPSIYWKVCWMALTPVFLLFVTVFSFVLYEPLKYGEYYVYPDWALALGWLLMMITLFPVVAYPLYAIWGMKGGPLERLKQTLQPTREWGPALNQDRKHAGYHSFPKYGKEHTDTRHRTQPNSYSMITDTSVV